MKVSSWEIKNALSRRHKDDFFMTEVKNGPTHTADELLIMDAVALRKSWANPSVIGYEIKVSRSDFTRDDKWQGYLQYCNEFLFACPDGLIKKEELPDNVGLIYFKNGTMRTVKRAIWREVNQPADFFKYILFSKMDNERIPFFGDTREYAEAYLQCKRQNKEIGHDVARRIGVCLSELKSEMRNLEYESRSLKELREIMRAHNVANQWQLEEVLSSGGTMNTSKLKKQLESIQKSVEIGLSCLDEDGEIDEKI